MTSNKHYKRFRRLTGLTAVLLTFGIVVLLASNAAAAKPPKSALDNVQRFIGQIEKAGFSSQEGSFTYFDLIKQVGERPDLFFSAMGNNPWPNAYFVLQMPNPDGVNYKLPYIMSYQMRQDEGFIPGR